LHHIGRSFPLALSIAYGKNDLNYIYLVFSLTYQNKVRSCKTNIARNHANTSEPLPTLVEASKRDFLKTFGFCLLDAKDNHVARKH
jgi:hypothetical protein